MAILKNIIPIKAKVIPIVQINTYFHVASRERVVLSWYINNATLRVVNSIKTHIKPRCEEKYTELMAIINIINAEKYILCDRLLSFLR
jgi:hypothetical protein